MASHTYMQSPCSLLWWWLACQVQCIWFPIPSEDMQTCACMKNCSNDNIATRSLITYWPWYRIKTSLGITDLMCFYASILHLHRLQLSHLVESRQCVMSSCAHFPPSGGFTCSCAAASYPDIGAVVRVLLGVMRERVLLGVMRGSPVAIDLFFYVIHYGDTAGKVSAHFPPNSHQWFR